MMPALRNNYIYETFYIFTNIQYYFFVNNKELTPPPREFAMKPEN